VPTARPRLDPTARAANPRRQAPAPLRIQTPLDAPSDEQERREDKGAGGGAGITSFLSPVGGVVVWGCGESGVVLRRWCAVLARCLRRHTPPRNRERRFRPSRKGRAHARWDVSASVTTGVCADPAATEPSPCGRVKTPKAFWGGVRRDGLCANVRHLGPRFRGGSGVRVSRRRRVGKGASRRAHRARRRGQRNVAHPTWVA
jgi:hypothetical protein